MNLKLRIIEFVVAMGCLILLTVLSPFLLFIATSLFVWKFVTHERN